MCSVELMAQDTCGCLSCMAGRGAIATIAHELQHVVEFLEQGTDDFTSGYSFKGSYVRELRTDLRAYANGSREAGRCCHRS